MLNMELLDYFFPKVLLDIDDEHNQKKVDEKIYKKTIFKQDYNSSPFAIFLRSKFFFLKKNYSRARIEIDKTINLLVKSSRPHNSITFQGNENGGYSAIYDSQKDKYVLIDTNFKKSIYDLAAEIYAELDNYDKSLQHYKRSKYYSTILKSDFDKIESGYVYSFRPISTYALSDIITNVITVCNPKVMNDPFDSLFQQWATKENFGETCSRKKHISPLVDSFRYFRIRSFVGNKDLTRDSSIIKKVTMWSHYADNHKGFCIRYKFSMAMIDHSNKDQYTHHFLKKVDYNKSNNRVNLHIKKIDTNKLYATKSYEWKYENEIRLISYNPHCEGNFLQIELDPESIIDAIYFGYRCVDQDIALIKKILGEQVKYYKMDTDLSNVYCLKIKQI